MKKYLQKIIWNFLYNHPMSVQHTDMVVYTIKKELLHDLCSRISIERMEQMLMEAKQSNDKYISLARLLEDNYK